MLGQCLSGKALSVRWLAPTNTNQRRLAACLHAVAAAWMSWHWFIIIQQYRALDLFTSDVGHFDYIVYNTLHGRFFWSPVYSTCFLTKHFTLILIPCVFLRWLFPHVLLLPLLESTALMSGIWAVAWLWHGLARNGRGIGRTFTPTAMVLGLFYGCNPLTGSLALAHHIESFAVCFSLWALAAWANRRKGLFWLFLALALLTKEDMALYWLAFGAWHMVVGWRTLPLDHQVASWASSRRFGSVVVLVTGVYLFMSAGMMYCLTRLYGQPLSQYLPRYDGLGVSTQDKIAKLMHEPWLIWSRTKQQLQILLPASLYLPVLAPTSLLILLPGCWLMGLSQLDSMSQLYYYYSYPHLPFLMLGTLLGLRRLERLTRDGWWHRWRVRRNIMVFAVLVAIAAWMAVLPTRTDGRRRIPPVSTPRDSYVRRTLRRFVPPDASFCAQFDLFCQLPARPGAYPLKMENLDRAEYWLIDLDGFYGDQSWTDIGKILDYGDNLHKKQELNTVFFNDGLLIARRSKPGVDRSLTEPAPK